MPKFNFSKVAKLHFGIGVLLYICCIFSEHLSLRTPLDDCFSFFSASINYINKKRKEKGSKVLPCCEYLKYLYQYPK